MNKVMLKRAGVQVSALALGTWAIGGGQWGPVEDNTSVSAIEEAIEKGITFIDTAPIYGMGHSEEVVARAIKGKRDKVFLATKCGLIWPDKTPVKDLSAASIAVEAENSLKRLGVDYIDLYQTHWPDAKVPLEETYGALLKLQREGKIKHIGVCNADRQLLEEIDRICPVATVQNEYSFLRSTQGEEVLGYCMEKGVGFLAYGPLAGGILSGKYDSAPNLPKSDPRNFFYRLYKGEAFDKAQIAVKRFKEVAAKYNVPTAAVALNWVRSRGEFVVPLAGAKTKEQVLQNAAALTFTLTQEDIAHLHGN